MPGAWSLRAGLTVAVLAGVLCFNFLFHFSGESSSCDSNGFVL